MTVSQFPMSPRIQADRPRARSSRDATLSDLMQSLRSTATNLGTAFQIDELSSLSQSIVELQSQLLETSEESVEGILVRQRCQRLLESAACGLLETTRNNCTDDIDPLLS